MFWIELNLVALVAVSMLEDQWEGRGGKWFLRLFVN
jgi:hypothetical protein